jgi:hypothetical protein
MVKSLTQDRVLAEKDVDVAVIGVHVSKTAAKLLQEGNIPSAFCYFSSLTNF